MSGLARRLVVCLVACALGLALPAGAAPPTIVAVEIVSPHRLPEERVRAAIGELRGRPRLRGTVRESLERVWALGLFSDAWVEEVAEPDGVRLRFHLVRAPHIEDVDFQGTLGVEAVDLAGAAGLGPGDGADPERLARAREDVRALYRREGYFSPQVELRPETDPRTNAVRLTFVVDAGPRARVGDIRLEGLRRAEVAAARRAAGLREGRQFREPDVRAAAERVQTHLREAGFPEATARAEIGAWDAATNRVPVTIAVDEGVRLTVEIEGAEAIDEAAIRERLTFPYTGIVDDVEVQASVRQVENLYRERGYHFVGAGGSLRREGDEARVRLSIVEGPAVSVESVELTGAVTVPAERLRAQMETRPPGLLRRGPFVQEALERDIRTLAAFLRARGYPQAQVGPAEVTFGEDNTRARVVVPIREGPLATVGNVAVQGHTVFTERELLDAVGLRPAAPWSEAAVLEGQRVIERRYARRGHHGVVVEPRSVPRDGVVDVEYRIVEGSPTRIGRIVVRGLTRTREHVVRRELPFQPGDPLDPEALVDAQRRLALLGFFERVEIEPLRPPTTPFADVIVTLREGKPWYVAVGAGYSTFEGVRGFLEAGDENILGTGRSLGARLRLSERNRRGELLYRQPWLFGTRWAGDASLFHEFREELGYDLERSGVATGIERPLLEDRIRGLRTGIRYTLSLVNRFDVDPSLVAEGEVTEGREIVASITPEVRLDRRDRPFDPSRGSVHSAALELGGVFVGGEADFLKWRLESAWFFDWLAPTVLAVGGRLGLATALLDSETLPIEERFFAGGATTVRGYRERRLGPLDARGNPIGGNALVVLNLEWRFPIWRWLGGAIFFDAGAVTPEVGDLALDELKAGFGAGIRVSTPVGPLRLDAGVPLSRTERDERQPRLHLSVGYPF